MARFYDTRVIEDACSSRYFASVNRPSKGAAEVEISEELHDALIDLQREFWRLDRRESRHTLHLEKLGENSLPPHRLPPDPAAILAARIEADMIRGALERIPPTQKRRFLLRYYFSLSIKQIAHFENCTVRAIAYSLARARENLEEILSE